MKEEKLYNNRPASVIFFQDSTNNLSLNYINRYKSDGTVSNV